MGGLSQTLTKNWVPRRYYCIPLENPRSHGVCFPGFPRLPWGCKDSETGAVEQASGLLEAPSPVLLVDLPELLETPVGQRRPNIWGLLRLGSVFICVCLVCTHRLVYTRIPADLWGNQTLGSPSGLVPCKRHLQQSGGHIEGARKRGRLERGRQGARAVAK